MTNKNTLTVGRQISDPTTHSVIPDLRSRGNNELGVDTSPTVFLPPRATATVACPVYTVISETQESTDIPITQCVDIPTIAAITTVRPTMWHKFLTATTNDPISPTSTKDFYLNMINHNYMRV